jgi:hypothetical protein
MKTQEVPEKVIAVKIPVTLDRAIEREAFRLNRLKREVIMASIALYLNQSQEERDATRF